jgi:DNA-binding CsgD family transcriptional regulator
MRSQILPKAREEVSFTDTAQVVHESAHKLIKDAVKNLEASSAADLTDNNQKVILDVEFDDVRCILIKLPPNTPRIQVILSPREHEIVRMVAEGYPNKTIAAVLDISSWTVGTYLRRIFAKLGVGSRAAMVARLVDRGVMIDQPRNATGSK